MPMPLKTRRWTRVEYERLVEHGLFQPDERIELLDGLLVVREPQGSLHAAAVGAAREVLQRAFGKAYHVREEKPVALDDMSEPEPDLAVVRGKLWDYRAGHPSAPVLMVEVADSSLTIDRRWKGALYARAGLREYWVVNLVASVLEIYRRPVRAPGTRHGWRYGSIRLLRRGATVTPLAAPKARVAVADLLPPR
jgi:Uma2 family endonuclease